MAAKIQVRRDLSSEWTANNPILGIGEQGWEIDTNKLKFGDGVSDWNTLPYFAGGSSYAGMAAEILASDIKLTLVNSDLFGIVDSEDSNLLKQFSWIDVKANLSDYFDTLYNPIITNSDDIIEGSTNLYNKIPVGGTLNQVLSKSSATDYDLSWVDASGGIEEAPEDGTPYSRQDAGWVSASSGGGGHVLEDNQVELTQRAALNVVSNGSESVLEDDAANDATKLLLKLSTLLDVDLTGAVDGDLLELASGVAVPQSTAPFTNLQYSSESNVTSDIEMSSFIPSNCSLLGIRIKADGVNDSGAISFGTASGASDIATETINATFDDVISLNSRYFSDSNDSSIFISGITGGSLSVYFLYIEGGFSDLPSSGSVDSLLALYDVFINSYTGKSGEDVVVNDLETGVVTVPKWKKTGDDLEFTGGNVNVRNEISIQPLVDSVAFSRIFTNPEEYGDDGIGLTQVFMGGFIKNYISSWVSDVRYDTLEVIPTGVLIDGITTTKNLTATHLLDGLATDKMLVIDTSGVVKKIDIPSGGGEPSDGDKGDITVSGSGLAWDINAASVDMNMINATGIADNTTYLRGDGVWTTLTGGTTSPGGTDGQLQYNDGGTFGGSTLSYDDSLNEYSIESAVENSSMLSLIDNVNYDSSNSLAWIDFKKDYSSAGGSLDTLMSMYNSFETVYIETYANSYSGSNQLEINTGNAKLAFNSISNDSDNAYLSVNTQYLNDPRGTISLNRNSGGIHSIRLYGESPNSQIAIGDYVSISELKARVHQIDRATYLSPAEGDIALEANGYYIYGGGAWREIAIW